MYLYYYAIQGAISPYPLDGLIYLNLAWNLYDSTIVLLVEIPNRTRKDNPIDEKDYFNTPVLRIFGCSHRLY